jgi:hypothetical protein
MSATQVDAFVTIGLVAIGALAVGYSLDWRWGLATFCLSIAFIRTINR